MKKLLVVLCLWICGGVVAQAPGKLDFKQSQAKWICYPEPAPESINHERYYRREFEVTGPLVSAYLFFLVDDAGGYYLDGERVAKEHRLPNEHLHPNHFSLQTLLPQGKHCLAFTVTNVCATGGAIARLELTYEDGTVVNWFTDDSWTSSKTAPDGWNRVGFKDADWAKCQVLGDIHVSPWYTVFNMLALRSKEEVEAENLIYARRKQAVEDLMTKLAAEPKPQTRVVYRDGQAYIMIGDKPMKPILYKNAECSLFNNATYCRQVEDFAIGGTHLHSLAVTALRFWRKDGSINHDAIHDWLTNYLLLDPDGYLMVTISLFAPPSWWREAYPEECVDYANGGRDLSEGDTLGRYVAPSMASQQWRRDATAVIREIVTTLEASPLASRIYAYRLDSGVYTEWHYYGMANGMPDCSKPMTEAFRQWLRQRYGTDAALQAAWKQPNVTLDTAVTPPREARLKCSAAPFRDPVEDRWTLDYLSCHGEVLRDCLLDFNKAAKEACQYRVLTGNFSGYFFGMGFPAEGWHLTNDEVLDSPYVDFQASPYVYTSRFRNLGEPGTARPLVDSYRLRGKLCLLEADSRTHIEPNEGHTFALNDADDVAMLARDLTVMLKHGCGLWFFDFCKCWYSTPVMRKFLHNMSVFREAEGNCDSVSEVVVVGDYGSIPYHAIEQLPQMTVHDGIDGTIRELGYTGVPFDELSFHDLTNPRLKDYKAYVFINLYYVDAAKRAVIDRLKKNGHTLIWLYAPGYLNEQGHSVNNIRSLTGIDNAVLPEPNDANVLSKAYPDWTSVLCAMPSIPRQVFRDIFSKAGIHVYCDDCEAVIYANSSMVMLHTTQAGMYRLCIPKPKTWTQFFPERRIYVGSQNVLEFPAEGRKTYLFKLD